MQECLRWQTSPGADAVARRGPAELPPAGRLVRRDGDHVDGRELRYREPRHQLRSTAKWFAEPTRVPDRPTPADISACVGRNKVSARHVPSAKEVPVPGACPSVPGPTFATGSTGATQSFRDTNPLEPAYELPSSTQPSHVYPVAAVESATKEGHVFERRRHPEWQFSRGAAPLATQNADIERSVPEAVYTRTRCPPQQDSIDYSDVPRSTAKQCARHRALARDGRAPVATGAPQGTLEPPRLPHGAAVCGSSGATQQHAQCSVKDANPPPRLATAASHTGADPLFSTEAFGRPKGGAPQGHRQYTSLAEQMDTTRRSQAPRDRWQRAQGLQDLHYPHVAVDRPQWQY